MIRRHKTTIFTDAKESSTVFELKRIVEGILKRPPDEQRLYKVRQAGASVVRVGTRWEVRRGCHIASGGGLPRHRVPAGLPRPAGS
jgi:hypothetical protein